jgi:hypothetical protein
MTTAERCPGRQYKIDQHAAIERQLLDGLGFNDFADTGVRRAENIGGTGDLDSLLDCANLEGDVDFELLSYFKMQGLRYGGKSGGRGGQFVVVGQEGGGVKQSTVVGDDCACGSRAERLEMQRGAGYGEGLQVPHGARNGGEIALAKSGC